MPPGPRAGNVGARSAIEDPAMVTVLTVDDHAAFRRAMAALLDAAPRFEQVGEAASGPEALRLAAELRPDLVLLDVRMPGMDGIETARRLRAADARTAIVLVSIDELEPTDEDGVAWVRKQELSTRKLDEVWERLATYVSHRRGAG